VPGSESESGGRLNQTPEANNAATWVGVNSTNAYNLTGKAVQIQVVQNPSATGAHTLLREFLDGNNCVSIGWTQGNLYAEQEIAGVWTTLVTIPWPMSPPVRALKLSFETTGWMFWEYSQDGVNFFTLYSRTTPFATTSLTTMIAAGTLVSTAAPGTAQWDNFNIPLALLTLTGTAPGKATTTASATRRRPVAGSITGLATVSVALTNRRALVGTSPGLGTAAGATTARRSLVAVAAGIAVTTGRFTLSGKAAGTSTADAVATPGALATRLRRAVTEPAATATPLP